MKCAGCRCPAPTTDVRCPCCGTWPQYLACVVCGALGALNTDMLLTTDGAVHDACRDKQDVSRGNHD